MNLRFLVLVGTIIFLVTSCNVHHKGRGGEIKILDGIEIDEREVPAVKRLADDCSTVFITDRVALTAAHCIVNKELAKIAVNGIPARRVFANPEFNLADINSKDVGKNTRPFDIAMLEFEKSVIDTPLDVSLDPVADNDQLELVGYGRFDYSRPKDSAVNVKKRRGTNIYKKNEVLNYGLIRIAGRTGPAKDAADGSGKQVAFAQGDSGSPLIVPEKGLVGIASQLAPVEGVIVNDYVDLKSAHSRDFFRRAIVNEKFSVPATCCECSKTDVMLAEAKYVQLETGPTNLAGLCTRIALQKQSEAGVFKASCSLVDLQQCKVE